MGIDVEGIEKQVRVAVPRQMGRIGHAGGKDHAVGLHAAGLRLAAQGGAGPARPLDQPQNRFGMLSHQPHPDVVFARRDLVGIVEAAQHDGIIGQAVIGPGPGLGADGPAIVVGLVAAGQADDLFRIEGLGPGRDHDVICDDVIPGLGPQAARIAQVVDLDRRQALRKQIDPAAPGIALEVDRDVEVERSCQGDDLGIGQAADLVQAMDRCPDPGCRVRIRQGVEGKDVDLEPVAVVVVQDAAEQEQGGMAGDVGRDIADADGAGRPGRPCRRPGDGPFAAIGFRTLQGPGRVILHAEQAPGRGRASLDADPVGERRKLGMSGPVGHLGLAHEGEAPRLHVVVPETDGLPVMMQRLGEHAGGAVEIAQIVMREGIGGVESQRAVIGVPGLCPVPHRQNQGAQIVVEIGCPSDLGRPAQGVGGVLHLAGGPVHVPHEQEPLVPVGPQPGHLLIGRGGALDLAGHAQDGGEMLPTVEMLGLDLDRLGDEPAGQVHLAHAIGDERGDGPAEPVPGMQGQGLVAGDQRLAMALAGQKPGGLDDGFDRQGLVIAGQPRERLPRRLVAGKAQKNRAIGIARVRQPAGGLELLGVAQRDFSAVILHRDSRPFARCLAEAP